VQAKRIAGKNQKRYKYPERDQQRYAAAPVQVYDPPDALCLYDLLTDQPDLLNLPSARVVGARVLVGGAELTLIMLLAANHVPHFAFVMPLVTVLPWCSQLALAFPFSLYYHF